MRTVIRRRSARCGRLAAVVVGSLLLGATGCGGDDEAPADKDVAGTELCGGKAVSAEASKALEVIAGSSRFEASEEKYTVAQTASDLVETWPRTTVGRDIACRIFTSGSPRVQIIITWGVGDGPPTGALGPRFTVLKMGERTLVAADKASVHFACRSDRLPTARKTAHTLIGVERWSMPKVPEGDVEALKDAYVTVAHSFSQAMAKELRCEKNGGLPVRPVLDPG
ncbi:hypothetical protein [Streptomyces flavalbus]|uniref:DUF3558 domain-containing protein n=1 Tax=Streptomyces flavalbus TaxID=2665155 RepID=A0ABW2WE57_9ACTN